MLKLGFFLFQVTSTGDAEGAVETTEVKQNLIDLIVLGGPIGIAIVVILLILSVAAVYIFVERWLTISNAGKVDDSFINNIRASVASNNFEGAKALCRNTDTPVARMVEKGLMRIGKPLKDIDAAIENVGNLEVFKLEKNLSTLASISGAAPMIGFLGTVTGMILAFYKMASEQNVTPDVLAGGIYQALITTALGLIIGIFSFVGYNLLVAKVEKVVYQMERSTLEFMDLLQEPG
ncbi:MAG: MotA/TolQ/ExbB proton channel family protein [Saprospiraceae bacterium]|mgnify:CR=1 FL=1|nr:MotA/TolQ/ExbB proton channel family protein [Saprospiraceae bacterium]MBK8636411.1 MotA/TolQ/ExbB proton channel family protein [Saprospiraceae bacterium]MBP7644081.1 MotA/TolQ/ExbB proton channel family protein [Saprospiraceae bacterium]HMS70498.1 MotA/TolQ/ExbB proton channel family protein [Saprospiraceae bacterium]HOY14225.1 MotA/TolQ/ExbB proton channel family protein [Saprospiraceae bacterium]